MAVTSQEDFMKIISFFKKPSLKYAA